LVLWEEEKMSYGALYGDADDALNAYTHRDSSAKRNGISMGPYNPITGGAVDYGYGVPPTPHSPMPIDMFGQGPSGPSGAHSRKLPPIDIPLPGTGMRIDPGVFSTPQDTESFEDAVRKLETEAIRSDTAREAMRPETYAQKKAEVDQYEIREVGQRGVTVQPASPSTPVRRPGHPGYPTAPTPPTTDWRTIWSWAAAIAAGGAFYWYYMREK